MEELAEFRRCQKCGQIERVSDDKLMLEGKHSNACDNEIEKWTRFTKPMDWQPAVGAVPREVLIPTAAFSDYISNFAIGFVRLEVKDNIEDAICAGTGTLVKLGAVHGILTAAHVLQALPTDGEVGLSQFFGSQISYRRQTIRMERTSSILIGGHENAPNGPDIAFLRLSNNDVGWLSAILSFYNLGMHRDDNKESAPTAHSELCIVGAIDERTRDLPPEREGERRKGFEAIITDANLIKAVDSDVASTITVKPKKYPDFTLPGNYGGTSGGALWRVFFSEIDGKIAFSKAQLAGVPFYQSASDKDGLRTLTCHSVTDIYGQLLEKIVETWPKETSLDQAALRQGAGYEAG
jgi:hypothetical protein